MQYPSICHTNARLRRISHVILKQYIVNQPNRVRMYTRIIRKRQNHIRLAMVARQGNDDDDDDDDNINSEKPRGRKKKPESCKF